VLLQRKQSEKAAVGCEMNEALTKQRCRATWLRCAYLSLSK